MKRTPLTRKTPLKSNARLKQTKGLRHTTLKTAHRNAQWRSIIMERAKYLIEKYGFLICEYSGETITVLSSVPDDMNEGWGHHIDGNRNNCTPENCYIVKYKYHRIIEDNNIKVRQEGFEGKQ
ncbi:MAG: hypothetical protein WC479_07435 [Candidatus Izemoplasmatales bacterium]